MTGSLGRALGVALACLALLGSAGAQTSVQEKLDQLAKLPGADPNDPAGVGIGVEADTAVSGNVIENAPAAGILLGWGRYMRDVAATGNVVRSCGVGIAVSVAAGAGPAVIADNLISGSRRGAILGMDGHAAVTGELAGEAQRFAHLTISGNRVR